MDDLNEFERYHYDTYTERICIRMSEGGQGERWAKNEAYKEAVQALIDAGLKDYQACRLLQSFKHRAVLEGVMSEY